MKPHENIVRGLKDGRRLPMTKSKLEEAIDMLRIVMTVIAHLTLLSVAPKSVASEASFPHKILQYLEDEGDRNLVVIDTGKVDGAVLGSVFEVYRSTYPAAAINELIWIRVGMLKLIDIQESYSIAEVTEDGTERSRTFFKDYPGVMAGDFLRLQPVTVVARQVVSPIVTRSYFELFEDPKAYPSTFELSLTGKEVMEEVAREFAAAPMSMLMIEAYTDNNGPADANQLESYQRALAVRHYLIDHLGFDESRLVAIGFGESEQLDTKRVPGYVAANRRIVFKIVHVAPDRD